MKKLKGFTLLELIIVMAIFSLIMYSAVQLLDPVSKFVVRSTNYENTTACMDNMRRCIEGNLKYADRVRAYAGYTPYNDSYEPSNDLKAHVKKFYNEFFKDRYGIGTQGTINVLIFDNKVRCENLSTVDSLEAYRNAQYNQGEIVMMSYNFDNTIDQMSGDEFGKAVDNGAVTINGNVFFSCTPWYVNQKLYGNFDYEFSLNAVNDDVVHANTDQILGSTNTIYTAPPLSVKRTDALGNDVTDINGLPVLDALFFNPNDFNISIITREISRSNGRLVRGNPTSATVASFSMKNVLNASDGYRTSSMDYNTKQILGHDVRNDFHDGEKIAYGAEAIPRYAQMDTNPVSDPYNGFYFIFTLPEEIDGEINASNEDRFIKNQRDYTETT